MENGRRISRDRRTTNSDAHIAAEPDTHTNNYPAAHIHAASFGYALADDVSRGVILSLSFVPGLGHLGAQPGIV